MINIIKGNLIFSIGILFCFMSGYFFIEMHRIGTILGFVIIAWNIICIELNNKELKKKVGCE